MASIDIAQERSLAKMQDIMKAPLAPPSRAFTRMTCDQMLESWNLNQHLNCMVSGGQIIEKDTPKVNFINSGDVSEKIAELSMKLVSKFIQNETASLYTSWKDQEKETSSARKRRLYNGISPGRRLSHLARRRQIFSRANLQQISQLEPKHRITIRKPSVSRNEFLNPKPAEGIRNLPKRALFQSPEQPLPRAGYKTMPRHVPRRRLFISADQEEQCLPGGGGSYDVSGWLASQPFGAAKKRAHDDPRESDSKRRCPRRSLDFSTGSPSRSSDSRGATIPTIPPVSNSHITSLHKQKLLWAVSVVLKEKNIDLRDKIFKTCGAALFDVCKKNLPAILSAEVNKRTTEKVLDFARLQVDSIVGDVVETMEDDCQKKPLMEVAPSVLNKEPEVRVSPFKGKENTKTPQNRVRPRNLQSGLKYSLPNNVHHASKNLIPGSIGMPSPALKRKREAIMVEATPEKSLDNASHSQVVTPFTSQLIEETPEKSVSDDDLGLTPKKACAVETTINSVNASQESVVPGSEDDNEELKPFPALIKNTNPTLSPFDLSNEMDMSEEIPVRNTVQVVKLEALEKETNDLSQFLPAVSTELDEVDGKPYFTVGECSTSVSEENISEIDLSCMEHIVCKKDPVNFSPHEIEFDMFASVQSPSIIIKESGNIPCPASANTLEENISEIDLNCMEHIVCKKDLVNLSPDEVEFDMFNPVQSPGIIMKESENIQCISHDCHLSELDPTLMSETSNPVSNDGAADEIECDMFVPAQSHGIITKDFENENTQCISHDCNPSEGDPTLTNAAPEPVPNDGAADEKESDKNVPVCETMKCANLIGDRGENVTLSVLCDKLIDGNESNGYEPQIHTSSPSIPLKKRLVKKPAWKIESGPGLKMRVRLSSEWDIVGRLAETVTPNSSLESSYIKVSSPSVDASNGMHVNVAAVGTEPNSSMEITMTASPATSKESYTLLELKDRLAIESTLQRDESELSFDASDFSGNFSDDLNETTDMLERMSSSSDINTEVVPSAYPMPKTSVCKLQKNSGEENFKVIKSQFSGLPSYTRPPRKSTPSKWKSKETKLVNAPEEISKSGVSDEPVLGNEEMSACNYVVKEQCEGESEDDIPLSQISARKQISILEKEFLSKACQPLEIPKECGFLNQDASICIDPMLPEAGLKETSPEHSLLQQSSHGKNSEETIDVVNIKEDVTARLDEGFQSSGNCPALLQGMDKMNVALATTPIGPSIEMGGSSVTSEERRKARLSLDAYKARKKLNMNEEEPENSKKITYITLKDRTKKKKHHHKKRRDSTDSERTAPSCPTTPEIYYEKIQTVVKAFHTITSTLEQEMKLTVAAVPDVKKRCCKLQKLDKVNEFTKGILHRFTSAYES